MIDGAPGRTSCSSAMPESTSAVCWASAAAMLTGAIEPMRRNGVTRTAWFAAENSSIASSMRTS